MWGDVLSGGKGVELPEAGPGPSQGPRAWAGSARRVSTEMGNPSTRVGFRQNQRPGVGKVGVLRLEEREGWTGD